MRENEKHTVIGNDGQAAFADYLEQLRNTDYTFEMEDADGRLVCCPLEEVIKRFQSFCGSDVERFRVRISYVDISAGTIGYIDREFERRK